MSPHEHVSKLSHYGDLGGVESAEENVRRSRKAAFCTPMPQEVPMGTDRLKPLAVVCLAILLIFCGTKAFGNDQQKAEKCLRRISAMAVESAAARAIVNQTMADAVHEQRM